MCDQCTMPPAPELKQCSTCLERKPLTDYSKNAASRDGLNAACRACLAARRRRAWEADPDGMRAKARAHQQRRPKPDIEKRRAYLAANAARIAEQTRQYKDAHREELKAAYQRWKRANPDKVREKKYRRRMQVRERFVERVTRKAVYERDRGICMICGKRCAWDDATIDHILPLSAGGEHSYRNVQLAHMACNRRRGAGRIPGQLRLI